MHLRTIIAISSLTLAFACNKETQLNGNGQNASASIDANYDSNKTAVDTDNETVDPPSNIAGSFLRCAVEEGATSLETESLLGCRFNDVNGNRVPVNTIATASIFTYRPANIPSLKVYPKILPNDNRYDAVYLFYADTKAELQQGVQGSRIFVKMKDLNGTDASVSGLVKDVQLDVNAIPEPRQTDYSQVRSDVLTEAGTNDPIPPVPGNE